MPKQRGKLFIDPEARIKQCGRCNLKKSFDKFNTHKGRSSNLSWECKTCKAANDKKYRLDYPDKILNTTLKKLYGITQERYQDLLMAQGHSCAICFSKDSKANTGTGRLHVDHIVVNGKKIVRGLLCTNCNTGLGKFNEDVELLKRSITYLKSSSNLSIK